MAKIEVAGRLSRQQKTGIQPILFPGLLFSQQIGCADP